MGQRSYPVTHYYSDQLHRVDLKDPTPGGPMGVVGSLNPPFLRNTTYNGTPIVQTRGFVGTPSHPPPDPPGDWVKWVRGGGGG